MACRAAVEASQQQLGSSCVEAGQAPFGALRCPPSGQPSQAANSAWPVSAVAHCSLAALGSEKEEK
jgi:hypothetical protein|eukprot:COSAG06_NODE_3240_length_5629_cov_8.011031_4_plen_66_part_00